MVPISIVRNILVRVGADVNPLQQSMTQAQRSLNQFSSNASNSVTRFNNSSTRAFKGVSSGASVMGGALKAVAGVLATAFAVNKLVEFGKGAIDLASNLNEVQNVVDVTFGGMSSQINDFANNALSKFGISELSAKKFSSTMGAMLKSSGITGDGRIKMSEGITGLSGDMASFYNISQDDAFQKIRSGISGETEPLKQLGVNMSVANMEAYALSQGIKISYQNMDQAHQSLLRYNYLMSVTKDAQGDFARTSNSWANQTRLLGEQWKIFQGIMGQGFINVLTPVLRGLNYLIGKLQIVAQYFTAFTAAIFGSAKTSSIAASAASIAAASNNTASKAIDNVGKSATKAGKAIKGSLGSFDQLNILSKSSADSMDDAAEGLGNVGDTGIDVGSTGAGTSNALEGPNLDSLKGNIDDIKKYFSEFSDFMVSSFGPSVQQAFNVILPVVEEWKKALGDTFKGFAELGQPLKNWFIDDLVPYWQKGIVFIGNITAGTLDSMLKVFLSFRDAVMPIFEAFVTVGLPLITSFASGCLTVLTSIFDTAKLIFDTLWQGVVAPAMMLISKIIIDTLNIINDTWTEYEVEIIGGLIIAFSNIQKLFEDLWTATLKPIVTNMLTELNWLWDSHLKQLVTAIADFIGVLIVDVLKIFNEFIVPIVDFLVKTLGPGFANAFSYIVDTIGTQVAVIIDVVTSIIKVFKGIIEFITGVFTGDWSLAWKGVKDIFVGIFEGIGGIFKGVVNSLIDGVNYLIRALNHIKIPEVDVPGVGKLGGIGINIAEIPKLAKGGLVSSPTLAMVGDNVGASTDPEVIAPLSKLKGILGDNGGNSEMITLLNKILEATKNKSGDVILKIGETEFGKASINSINNVQRQAGTTLLIV